MAATLTILIPCSTQVQTWGTSCMCQGASQVIPMAFKIIIPQIDWGGGGGGVKNHFTTFLFVKVITVCEGRAWVDTAVN